MHDPVQNLVDALERLVFTAARNWERKVTIHHADRDNIIDALRRGLAARQASERLKLGRIRKEEG